MTCSQYHIAVASGQSLTRPATARWYDIQDCKHSDAAVENTTGCLLRGVNCDGGSAEGRGTAEGVDGEMIGQVVDAGAGVLLSHREVIAGAIVAPAVRNAHDARHHLVGYFQRQHDLAHARSHEDVFA